MHGKHSRRAVFGGTFCLVVLLLACGIAVYVVAPHSEGADRVVRGETKRPRPSLVDCVHHQLWKHKLVKNPSAPYLIYMIQRDVKVSSEWE
jgi:hypothetical protein